MKTAGLTTLGYETFCLTRSSFFRLVRLTKWTFTPRSSQSEDCLFLNIWTPSGATAESKLPVLFWIHGGAFIQGSGGQPRYDGTELAKRGAARNDNDSIS
ncbi:MAG: carboxylesterase family protein [Pirellulaceae bacterium]|nr:carboxylesterase family protein [Pirellulaceae bacterium]